MPEIYRFLGLSFRIYVLEQHNIPHVHIYYGEYKASISIGTQRVLAGYLPAGKRKLAEALIRRHRPKLLDMYEQARRGIDPGKLRGM